MHFRVGFFVAAAFGMPLLKFARKTRIVRDRQEYIITKDVMRRRVMAATVLWILMAAAVLIILRYCFKGKKKLAALFYMSVPGLGTLVVLNMLSAYTGIVIPLNLYNLITSVFLGLPGITGLVVNSFVA